MPSSLTCQVARRALLLALVLIAGVVPASARTYYAAQLNTEQYKALDRNKTAVILQEGIFEEHGPFLPAFTDGYVSERLTKDVADAIVGRGWDVVIFPIIPLGAGGVNEVAAKYPFPGTFTVQLNTLRTIYMDLADELGEAGFKWIFIINTHGAPNHNRALDQACAYFDDTYKGRMVKLTGRGASGPDPSATLSEQARREDNSSGHGGINETSLLLFIDPNLVDPAYKKAQSFTVGAGGMIETANRPDWRGYFGAPQFSSAEYGAKLYERSAQAHIQQAFDVLDGKSPRVAPAKAPTREADEASLARDRANEQRHRDWMTKNGMR